MRGENRQTYQRAEFGDGWSDDVDAPSGRNGCDTRDDVLRRDLKDLREGDRNAWWYPACCTTRTPASSSRTPTAAPPKIQTDHVVALGAAWRAGAWAWTPAQRLRLRHANDLDVLPATDKQTNYDKSSRTPDKWKPPNRGYWCEYGRRWTGIKAKYRLTVTPPEKQALQELPATCPA